MGRITSWIIGIAKSLIKESDFVADAVNLVLDRDLDFASTMIDRLDPTRLDEWRSRLIR